jgi:hypothetical protein
VPQKYRAMFLALEQIRYLKARGGNFYLLDVADEERIMMMYCYKSMHQKFRIMFNYK